MYKIRPQEDIDKIKQNVSPPIHIKNFLSKNEIEFLKEHKNNSTNNIEKVTEGVLGVYMYLDFWDDHTKKLLYDRISKIIGDFDVTGGGYFKTFVSYKLHTDGAENIPYKNIIIPLTVMNNGGIIIMQQYWFHYNSNFFSRNNQIAFYNEFVTDYTEMTNKKKDAISEHDYSKYLKHIKKSDLGGISIDQVIFYEPGDCIIFDSCQVHCGVYFEYDNKTFKEALSLFTVKN